MPETDSKTCLLCGDSSPADASTCPNDGEASWSVPAAPAPAPPPADPDPAMATTSIAPAPLSKKKVTK